MKIVAFLLLVALPLLAGAQAPSSMAGAQAPSSMAGAQAPSPSYLDLPGAIKKASRQRMLAEFVVKEYLQVLEGVDAPVARDHLALAVTIFDDQLGDLISFASTSEQKQAVGALEKNWGVLREQLTMAPDRNAVPALRAAARRVLQAAERNTEALQPGGDAAANRAIELAGRQAMLSQRIAKDHLLLSLRYDEPAVHGELRAARAEFAAGLAELGALPWNSEEIRLELAEAGMIWANLEKILQRERLDRGTRGAVVAATDVLLARMERAAAAYQRQASR
jgi:hypothetical protein